MVKLFVLDLQEFSPIVEAARNSGYDLKKSSQGYWEVSSESTIQFQRKPLKIEWALWYTCLSGGVIGTITQFDRDQIIIEEKA